MKTSIICICFIILSFIMIPIEGMPAEAHSSMCNIQKVEAVVTAYTSGYESTGKRPNHPAYGITKSGERVRTWRTIAMDSSVPFGTMVYIPFFKDETNNGWFVVEDRGSAIRLNRRPRGIHKVDVYMDDLGHARKFGRQTLDIYIIDGCGGK